MKTFLNRLVSKVFKWLYFINQKSLFKGLIVAFVCLFLFGIIELVIPRLAIPHSSKTLGQKYKVTDVDSYLHIYETILGKLRSDTNLDLSNDNFVKQKLKKFIAIAYLTSRNDSKHFTEKFDFVSYKQLVDELTVIFEIEHFYNNLFGCQELQKFSFQSPVLETSFSLTYEVSFNKEVFNTQSVRANIEELLSAKCSVKHQNDETKFRCFLLKNRRIFQQYLFLSELKHSNIAQLKGACFKTDEAAEDSFPGLTLMKEGGKIVEVQEIKSMPWNVRLKICYDLIQLMDFLSSSPIGPVYLSNLSPVNFFLTASNQVKLTNFDQELSVIEKPCKTDADCYVGTNYKTSCVSKTCFGYNERKNMQQIYFYFIEPLLSYNTPSALRKDIQLLLKDMKTLHYLSLTELLTKLKTLTVETVKEKMKYRNNGNVALDGLQVDSWQQHENIVSINEIGVKDVEEVKNIGISKEKLAEALIQNSDPLADNYGYEKIENADFPGRFDYYCPHSKAEWGCVISLRTLKDAALKCDLDSKCKAFITMPHLRKEGWIIAIMKSDNASPVDHAGTTIYIKNKNIVKALTANDGLENDDNPTYSNCWKTIVDEQVELRNKKEIDFMNSCGWNGFKSSALQDFITENTLKDAISFKPALGKMSVGGQMRVKIESESQSMNCIFSAKSGPIEYHLAQLATYHLDRMLGLYKTVPVYLRTLTALEMKDAGFPRDIGGAQFDTFISLKSTTDHSLCGTITPIIPNKVTWEHYITVPKLEFITNAVTPFSKRQLDDMEYLLLIWLSSLPMPQKGFLCVEDHLLVLTKMEEAFRLTPTEEVIGYFYNCQFPKSFIDVMQRFHKDNCYLGDQLLSHMKHYYPNLRNDAFKFEQTFLSDVVTRNANRLLEVVDTCVGKFGEDKVFYTFDK